jgi:hypothetical protein
MKQQISYVLLVKIFLDILVWDVQCIKLFFVPKLQVSLLFFEAILLIQEVHYENMLIV